MPEVRLTDLTLRQLSDAIAAGDVSSAAATQACLEAVHRYDGAVNAFLAVDAEGAMRQAEAADREIRAGRRRGPLHGVPLAHKDMFYRKGEVSTCGSRILADRRADRTAAVLERLDGAGQVTLGRLHMAEFAVGPTGHNDHYGPCRNPWNSDHISGGSSSGSGAAVAARFVYGSIGSDTGGSIRLPAGICGVTGVKTTYGRVSRYGGMPRCWSLDVFGPLARTAEDCALLLEAIAGPDQRDAATVDMPVRPWSDVRRPDLSGLAIGIPEGPLFDELDAAVRAQHDGALAVLRDLGARIAPVAMPNLDRIYALTNLVNKAEAAALHRPWIDARPQDYNVATRARIEAGFHVPAPAYIEALNLRAQILDDFLATSLGRVDMLYVPLLLDPVPTIAATAIGASGEAPAIVDRVTRCTRWASYLGIPGVAFCCGFTAGELPVAAQLLGRPFAEGELLAAVDVFQRATDWHQRRPKLTPAEQGLAAGSAGGAVRQGGAA